MSELVIPATNRSGGTFQIQELLECRLKRIEVIGAPSFLGREANQIWVEAPQPYWLVFGIGFNQSFLRSFKRFYSLLASLIILLLSTSAMLIIDALICIEGSVPVTYQHERVDLKVKTFIVLKFRSMTNNAENARDPHRAIWKDPREILLGPIIRILKSIELQQVLNVLRGDTSFVCYLSKIRLSVNLLCKNVTFCNTRQCVKPFMNSFAQIRCSDGASLKDSVQKVQYDL